MLILYHFIKQNNRIQHYLQGLQKSSFGWQLATELIQTDSPNCQFFGALTFTVKINTYHTTASNRNTQDDEPNLSNEPTPKQMLSDLLSALVYLINKAPQVQGMVFRKLLSTLSKFFTKFYTYWHQCIYSVIFTLATGTQQVLDENGEDHSNVNSIVSLVKMLDLKKAILALEFCQMLIEDVYDGNMNSTQESQVTDVLKNFQNIDSLIQLLIYCCHDLASPDPLLSNTPNESELQVQLARQIFKTYGTCAVNFIMPQHTAQQFAPITLYIFTILQKLSAPAVIASTDEDKQAFYEEIRTAAVEPISEVLNRYPSFYPHDVKTYLGNILVEWGSTLANIIISKNASIKALLLNHTFNYDEDPDIDHLESLTREYLKITIALCESEIGDPDRLNSPEITTLFNTLLALSDFPGIPYVDNNLAMYLIEFWSTYADSFLDNDEDDIIESNPIILQVIEIFWKKIIFPPSEIRKSWNLENWEAFDTFRKDFFDLLELTYPLVGKGLFSTLIGTVLENLAANEKQRSDDFSPNNGNPASFEIETRWANIEAALASITVLSDSLRRSDDFSDFVRLLDSSLFQQIGEYVQDKHIRTTAVNFVGEYDFFFEMKQGKPFLFGALDYLFKSLNIPSLANIASKSIQQLCSSSRAFLSQNLQDFFSTYTGLHLYERLDTLSHQRTVLAIAYIIQPIQDLQLKAVQVERLLDLIIRELEKEYTKYTAIHNDQHNCSGLTEAAQQALSESSNRIVSLLKCIANIGKGLQEPDDLTQLSPQEIEQQNVFWNSEATNNMIRNKIIEIVNVFAIQRPDFSQSVTIIEACCEIFKASLKERYPGPFVFPDDVILGFIKAKAQKGEPQTLALLTDFTCTFVASHSGNAFILPDSAITDILNIYTDYLSAHEQKQHQNSANDAESSVSQFLLFNDPELHSSVLKLFTQIMKTYSVALISHPSLLLILKFTAGSLDSNDRFILRESSRFWTSFISCKSPNLPTNNSVSPILEALILLGPELVRSIVKKISGDSARSELDFYIDVLSQLLSKRNSGLIKYSTQWLNDALVLNPPSPVDKVDQTKRTLIYKQLTSLRSGGTLEIKKVVKEYWLSARGITDYV